MELKYGKYGDFPYIPRVKNSKDRGFVGINDSEFILRPAINGIQTQGHPAYLAWSGILDRCAPRYQKLKPTYEGVSCSEDWTSFTKFALWFKINYVPGYIIDKDLLIRGNKVYSAASCLFLPVEINSFLTTSGKVRGDYPQGVTKSGEGRYRARISIENKRTHIGYYSTPEAAHKAWQQAKINRAQELMQKYNVPQMQLVIDRILEDIELNRCTESI